MGVSDFVSPVFSGTLIKIENDWFVSYERTLKTPVLFNEEKLVKDKLQVFLDEKHTLDLLEKNLNKTVEFTVAKKFLALETLWYANIKFEQKKETWDDVFEKFTDDNYGIKVSVYLVEWFKKTYKVPKKK